MGARSRFCLAPESSGKSVLVFSPEIDGHRQNYCCVVSDWFLRSGYRVVVAVGRTPEGQLAAQSPLIGMLAQRASVHVLDLGDTTNSQLIPGRWVRTLRDLEEHCSPDWTFLPTGDEIRIPLDGLDSTTAAGHARRAAIFIGNSWLYRRDFCAEKLSSRPYRWARWQGHRLKELHYFKSRVWDSLGLCVAFHTNSDFFLRSRDPRFRYLPELYRAWGFSLPTEDERIQALMRRYRSFLAEHPGRKIILYYGGWAARRGYDHLMQLASQEPDTLFVSCGRPSADNAFRYDVRSLRERLRSEHRLFEVELPFLPENEFVDLLYRSCDFVLLPYRDFYGLSGIMVQAASFGKPVLVPSVGYMNSMVAKHKIGLTFRHKDDTHFYHQFGVLRDSFGLYTDAAARFGQRFTLDNVEAALAQALL